MKRLKKFALWSLLILVSLLALGAITLWVVDEERPPSGETGAPADQFASRMEEAVDLEAWQRTGAVRWTFAERHAHLWDRDRDLVRVRWDDTEALLYAGTTDGRVFQDGQEVHGHDAASLLLDAHEFWINDSFWLNPVAKLRDEGVTLSVVEGERGDALMVSYTSGGVTPGDAYVWYVDDVGRPMAWRMWVSIIPIGGVETSWEGWTRLSTGAWVSTEHAGPLGITLRLTDVEGAETLAALLGSESDPFERLVAGARND